jgi:NADPH:quinone reductase
MIDASRADVAALVHAETNGHGADIVYNTVGSPYFAAANQAMAHGGTQILISTIERPVPFDIFAFYRGQHTFVGIDSLALDARASAALLRELLPGFASGKLRPLPVVTDACFPLEHAIDAYRRVQAIAQDRVVLVP